MLLPIGDNIERKTIPILPGVLVFLNLAVFAREIRFFVDNPDNPRMIIDFITTWGLVPTDLENGRLVGLVTHMFLHGGIMHIVGNMLVLWAFACSLEVGLGKAYLLAFYLAWGVAAGALHAFMEWGSDTPLVGASGAIAGLMGAYTVLYGADSKIKTLLFIGPKPFVIQVPAALYGVGWFGLQVYSARMEASAGIEGGVAWYAHIGGFLAGVITAAIIKSDLDWELVQDRDGELLFKARDEDDSANKIYVEGDAYEYAENDVSGNGGGLPPACPYCAMELTEEEQITPGVAKCANPECDRFVYAGAICV